MTDLLGPYELRGELGRGAMAIVWRAWDTRLEREVAIKEPVIPSGMVGDAAAEFSERFVREARAAAKLNHPGIVTIYAADVYDSRPAIVMELIEGGTLAGILDRGALSLGASTAILDQLLDAAAYAHSRGVVHRDIKPDNVFLTDDGRVKLADFGIAHVESSSTLTQAGTVMGTPGYMSPEQVTGQPVDSRADIFSIGVIGYEMLTGRNPFGATDGVAPTTVMYRVVHEPVLATEITAAGVPAQVAAVLQAATAKDPGHRFPDAGSFRAALAGGPIPVAPAGNAGALPSAPAAGYPTASAGRPSWLPYAIVGGVGLVVVGALLAFSTSGGGAGGGPVKTPAATAPGGPTSGVQQQPAAVVPPAGPSAAELESEIRAMLEAWRLSRQSLDFNTYISFYASDFRSADSGGQNYSKWSASKRKVYGTTDPPTITCSNISIVVSPDGQSAEVTLDQRYRSAKTNDDGQKSMTLRRTSSGWVIVREDFHKY